ncbi:MAG: serine hydrolase domain-containing protein [Acidobacteriota bacterium]
MMSRTRFLIFLVLLSGLLTAPALLAQDADTPIQSCLDQIRDGCDLPGSLVATFPSTPGANSTVYTGGVANLSSGQPLEGDMQYRIGSTTKTFVATVVLQLIDEGRLDYDDTLQDLLGPAVAPIQNADRITVEKMLGMRSGIPDFNDCNFQIELFTNPRRAWTPQEIVNTLEGVTPEFDPDDTCSECGSNCYEGDGIRQCWKYSNSNYLLLGMIIEAITGNRLENELENRLIIPLGLNDTYFATEPRFWGHRTRGYLFWPEDPSTLCDANPTYETTLRNVTSLFNPTAAWAAGAMVSTAPDLTRWVQALVSGELLSPETQRRRLIRTNADLAGIPLTYGLGLMEVFGFLGHGGEFFGYANVVFQNPTCGQSIIDMVNVFPEASGASYYSNFLVAAQELCGQRNCSESLSYVDTNVLSEIGLNATCSETEAQRSGPFERSGYRGGLWHVY